MTINQPLFVKVSVYPFDENSRDQREIESAFKAGWTNIHVVTSQGIMKKFHKKPFWGLTELELISYGSTKFKKLISKVVVFFRFVRAVRNLNPKLISGHDLLGLLIGYFASLGRLRNTILVYDAHEYEKARYGITRNIITQKLILFIEKFLIKRSAISIIVNESIAKKMQSDYSYNFPYIVVRNIPIWREVDQNLREEVRRDWLQKLNKDEDTKILLYHGLINDGRGLEVSIDVLVNQPDLVLVILGYGDKVYLQSLKTLCIQNKVEDRVLFIDAVTSNVLPSYIAASDIGLILIQPVSTSYYLSLPNKLFETIQAGNPVIGSNFPEIEKVIQDYCIGKTCDPTDYEMVSQCLQELINNYSYYKKNVIELSHFFSWENEENNLVAKFKELHDKNC